MKRIVCINYEYPPLGGGAGKAFASIMQELSAEPIIIDVITGNHQNIYAKSNIAPRITHYRIPVGTIKNYHYQTSKNLVLFNYHLYNTVKKLISINQYDHNLTFFTIPCGLISYYFRNRVPYSIFLRGSDVPGYNTRFAWHEKILFKRLAKKIWGGAQHVIANSHDLKKLAHKTAPQQKILVIQNGVNTDIFTASQNKKNETFNILTVSRLITRKNIPILLSAFANFHKKNQKSKLTIIGDGPKKNQIQENLKKLNLSSAVDVLGYVEESLMPSHYHHHHVYVSTSLHEGMSNALLEAMASGLPIITTDTGGAQEIISESNGYIIPTNNVDALVTSLEKIHAYPKLREHMSKKNREKALTYSWKKVAEQYMRLL